MRSRPVQAQLLPVESPHWTELLSGMQHDFYHVPSFVRFAAQRQEPGVPLAFAAEEDGHRFLAPLIVRPVPDDMADTGQQLFDATCPRGYPGPLVALRPDRDPGDFVDRAIAALAETLRRNDIVSAFIRLHPLIQPPLEPISRAGPVVQHGSSIAIDLTLSQEELWRQTNHGHRSRISKARRLGYRARVDADWSRFGGLVDLYRQSMARVGADEFWRLSDGYFEDLRASLKGHIHLLVVEQGQELAAAALFTEVDGIVEVHLSGTADAFVSDSPSKLLIDAARSWAKDRGNRYLHLAGSLRPDDSLAQFKTGFSPLTFPVQSWRLITDPDAYHRLANRWEAVQGVAADAADGYFPAYRKPAPGVA